MFTTGEEAIKWIDSRVKHGTRPGLVRIQELLRRVKNPERDVRSIHIAGTNGKGSTVAFLRCLLQEKGVTVGTFTSPFIESFYERIAINGQMISERDFISLANYFAPIVSEMDANEEFYGISQFEILTGMAFYYFKDQVDVAIIETGIGGLLDSTNVVHPELTAITTVGLDHVDILGDTLAKIAWQKAGIIKEGIPIVVGKVPYEAEVVIRQEATKKNAPFYIWRQDYQTIYQGLEAQKMEEFTFKNKVIQLENLEIPLTGHQQVENAAVALELFYLYCYKYRYPFASNEITVALKKVTWPARMEVVESNPTVIVDGAHNPHAIRRLKENIMSEYQTNETVYVLFSAIITKDIHVMLQELLSIPNIHLILTTFDYPNALKLEDYQSESSKIEIVPQWEEAFKKVKSRLKPMDVLFVTGSLYFVSAVRHKV